MKYHVVPPRVSGPDPKLKDNVRRSDDIASQGRIALPSTGYSQDLATAHSQMLHHGSLSWSHQRPVRRFVYDREHPSRL